MGSLGAALVREIKPARRAVRIARRACLLALLAVPLWAPHAWAGAIIDNGVVQLGVNDEGHLNVPGGLPSSGEGTTEVGLRYLPTGADAVSPGCECEGWGAADATSGVTGYANDSTGGAMNLTPVSFTSTASTAVSVVDVGDTMRVTHDYHPSTTPNLYETVVTLENTSDSPIDARYRRVMDWDVEPTAFSEFVSANIGTSTKLLDNNNDGFATADPLGADDSGTLDSVVTGNFTDVGPDDHGARFDFGLGTLAPGSSVSFKIFYGAAATEADANAARSAVGTEVFSFGQPDGGQTSGAPNTFVFGFAGVGGSVIPPAEDCDNGIDDDEDGAVDGDDSDCGECSDGVDNDNDGETDHPDDQGCADGQDPTEDPDAPQCSDRLDNDGDGATNFPDDPGCTSPDDDTESPDPDTEPPNTAIISGPTGTVRSTSASFRFSSSEPGSSFQCRRDGGAWAPCRSPKAYSRLPQGPHTFDVRATDRAGNTDATPARRNWRVDTVKPRVTTVSPSSSATRVAPTANVLATFSEAMRPSTVNGTTVKLVRRGTTTPLRATVTYDASRRRAKLDPRSSLARGAVYTATVTTRATDSAGNALAATKSWSFTVRR